jgi:ankyrin repeat protein
MKLAIISLACLLTACQSGPPVSPLIAAAREGDTQNISALVKSGADVNQRGGVNNWTPLMHAVHKNQPAAVGALIDAGADVNLTALRLAPRCSAITAQNNKLLCVDLSRDRQGVGRRKNPVVHRQGNSGPVLRDI